ncbi:type III pantothenate kinase [Desulfobacter hydrogenophilus]|uniref:Type III pantothenate kinase n=1 Tax=Desulfobacter hydrogenophilus TaxID=2291 RepID=A0A328F7Z9_9BACT|nr:type III pantothenate kinase [Desulfobacter hydrogenophilus]NDY73430.1 type III pantothenate kinase [Desulfobacter hydrogenophilus]QBH12404.1 type III pantothenate kinase [Desulfobacter hydrogenophilus]RAM00758.1 type III pantothenate kinase [Desulfobacter hydrogenophilus]
MLLVIDVGNTNTVIGVYENETLAQDWRIRTIRETTADEFNILARALFADKCIQLTDITKIVISSVVPSSVRILNAFCERYLGITPLWINSESVKKLMPILYSNPNEVGADRIVNAVAAYEKYKKALIIIDFGTATTFDAISEKGEYLGGAICPGVGISAEALFQRTSRLPRVEIFKAPEKVIGDDTIESIKSGIIFGNAAMVDGMVDRMKQEMKTTPMIIATGGLAPLIAEVSNAIESVDLALTLDGLKIISRAL